MSVMLYVDLKKKESGFGIYPLCINTVDLSDGELQVVDTMNGSINCVKIRQNEYDIIGLVESDNVDSSCKLYVSNMNILWTDVEI